MVGRACSFIQRSVCLPDNLFPLANSHPPNRGPSALASSISLPENVQISEGPLTFWGCIRSRKEGMAGMSSERLGYRPGRPGITRPAGV